MSFCDKLWFLASHLIKPIWWRLERSLAATQNALAEQRVWGDTDDCHLVVIVVRKPEFLPEDEVRSWACVTEGRSHQMMHCVISCAVTSPFLSLLSSHPCAFHFLPVLRSYGFFPCSSAFHSSYASLFPTLCSLKGVKSLPFFYANRALAKNALWALPFLSLKTSQLADFVSVSLPCPVSSFLPPLTLVVEDCKFWKFQWKYLYCMKGKSSWMQVVQRRTVTCSAHCSTCTRNIDVMI